MSTMAEVLAKHWSASTHTECKPVVDKCDGCGAVVMTWGTNGDMPALLAKHQADELAKAGYRKPEVISPEKLRIDGGYLELEVDHCTCGGYGEPYYAHENGCGLEPLTDISAALAKAGYQKHAPDDRR